MANLSNINNKFIVTSETEALIGATSWTGVGSGTLAAGLIISGNTSQFILDNPSYNHFTMYSASDSNIYNIFGSSGNYLIGTGNKDTSSWSQKFRIDSSGRVGIGITPSLADVKLHTYNNSTNAYNIFESSTRKWVFGQVGDVAQVAGVYGLHGGVQVDGATGDVGIGTDSPGARIDIKGVAGSPATSGTTQNGILRIQNATNNNTLDIGQVAGSPYGTWLQAADKSDLNPTYTYPILLNPLGGNVGIGVTGPVTKLELPGSLSNSSLKVGTLEMQSYSVNNAWLADNLYFNGSVWKLRSAGYGSQVYFGSGGDITFKRYPTGSAGGTVVGITSLQLQSNGNVYIPGNVGINNTSPAKKLEISSPTSSDGILLTGDGTGGGMSTGSYRSIGFSYTDTDTSYGSEMKFEIPDSANHGGQISFWTDEITTGNSVRAMTISRSQNVGIGTASPQGRLDSVAPVADLTDFGRATGSALNIRIANVIGHLGQINFCNDAAPAFGYGSIGMVMTSGSGVGLGDMVFGTKSSGSAVVSTERMRITSAGDIQIPTDSASLQLRSSGSGSYTSIRRDAANQLIVANTAGNQVFGIGNGGELSIANAASYSNTLTYGTGWNSSYQTLIPTNTLQGNSVYIITIRCDSFGVAPYYASAVFHIVTSPAANGPGRGNANIAPTATHVNSAAYWNYSISTAVGSSNGVDAFLQSGPTPTNTVLFVKATKIMDI